MGLICLLLAFLLPLAAIAELIRRALRPLSAAAAYRNVAWRLGVEADTRGTSLRGRIGGRRLFVGEVVGDGTPRLRAVLDLSAPLGVGLLVQRRSSRRLGLRRRKTWSLGDPRIDRAWELRAFDVDRARALLDPAVREALLQLAVRYPTVELTDRWVRVSLRRQPPSDKALHALIDGLRALVDAIEQARERLPTPPELAHVVADWASLAAQHGLDLDPSVPSLRGAWHGRALTIYAVRAEEGHVAELILHRATPLRLGLRLLRQATLPATLAVGQDIEVGEPAFDAAFVVKGWDVASVRRRLGPEVRARLLALHAVAQVEVDDDRLWLHGVPTDVGTLARLLDLAGAASSALDAEEAPPV